MADTTVVLVGTLDTKGREYAFLRDRLHAAGVGTVLVDAGIMGPPLVEPDVQPRGGRARPRAPTSRRCARPATAARPCSRWPRARPPSSPRLYAEGRCDGVLAAGGSGNTSIAAEAMRALPVGVPKLIVSTIAAGDTRPIVGASDMLLAASVVDVAGINSVSARILANAAAAMAGMVQAAPLELGESRPLIAAVDVRRHHAVRHARGRGARRARLRGADVPHDRHRRALDGGADRRAASSPACSTRRPPSCATSSSAACSARGPTASRRPGAPACRRWSRWARSTWSTSARARRSRRSSRIATCTSTTPR